MKEGAGGLRREDEGGQEPYTNDLFMMGVLSCV